jgi:protein TonB
MSTARPPTLSFLAGLAAAVLLAASAGCGGSQQAAAPEQGLIVLEEVETPPEIIGGYAMVDSLKRYPQRAAADGATGVVEVQFVVTARGRATRVRTINQVHNALRTEASRIVNELRFRPGKVEGGAPVPIEVRLPIRFTGREQ